jgi:large subunit ribosomal protein L25
MSSDDRATLDVHPRETRGSRNARRMRLQGRLPGVLYGRGREPQALDVDERQLRNAIKAGHALMDLQLGKETVPVLIKDQQHHPVRGGYTHVDFVAVDLKQKVQAAVPVELTGADEAPGVVQGGVLDQVMREINIEVLPTEIPDSIPIDVSSLELNGTLLLSEVTVPGNFEVLDSEESVVATVTPPSRAEEPEAVEEETEVVGEGEEVEAAPAEEAEGEATEEGGGE